ncbi:AAA domain-containing protein [Vibrio parahaemolyticus]|nr:AAA domain-containing protein [Vibrio parahaemolyticus]
MRLVYCILVLKIKRQLGLSPNKKGYILSTTPTILLSRKERIQQLMESMNNGLLEREHQVRLILLAALSGEHTLLIGPPGTAKSELAKRLKDVFIEANYFERLVTRFSVPEELFGPLSIKALEEDRYNRLTSGYLPEASVAFIDEIFKANSAILNSLLTLLNERQFDNGNRRLQVPLISVVAASNELPQGEELNALYDRFILRSYVGPVSSDSFESLLLSEGGRCEPELSVRLKLEELHEVQKLAEKVEITGPVIELCKEFKVYLAAEDIYVSDRRWRKLIKLMKVSAFTSGLNEVSIYDGWILPHCLWEKPEQLEGLQDLYKRLITVDAQNPPKSLTTVLTYWEERLKQEKNQTVNKYDSDGRELYIDPNGKETTEPSGEVQKINSNGQKLYENRYSEETTESSDYNRRTNAPIMMNKANKRATELTKYSKAHVEGRVAEVKEIISSIDTYIKNVSSHASVVGQVFDQHLWLEKSMLPQVLSGLEDAKKQAENLKKRATKLHTGFENLPMEGDLIEVSTPFQTESEIIDGELCD